MIDGPPPDARDLIGALLVFRHLDDAGLDALAAAVEWLHVPAGARLFTVGDEPDGMYGLISGRVRFFAEEDGWPVMTAEGGPGITFGEGSLLVGGGRSRTAVVVRDALLVRLPPELFTTLMATSPEIATRVAKLLAARIAFKYEPIADGSEDTVLVGATDQADFDWFVDSLRRATGRRTRAHGRARRGAAATRDRGRRQSRHCGAGSSGAPGGARPARDDRS